MHHIGEYYEYRYKKPWRKQNAGDTAGFRTWMLQQNTNAIEEILKRDFDIFRDNLSCGFLIKRKVLQRSMIFTCARHVDGD